MSQSTKPLPPTSCSVHPKFGGRQPPPAKRKCRACLALWAAYLATAPLCPQCQKPAKWNCSRRCWTRFCSVQCSARYHHHPNGPSSDQCPKCGKKKYGIFCQACRKLEPTAAGPEHPLPDRLYALLKHRRQASVEELASQLECSSKVVLATLNDLQRAGRNLHAIGNAWILEAVPRIGGIEIPPLLSTPDGWHKFGVISDTHLCSVHERLDVLRDAYRLFENNGVKVVLHSGNYIDGEAQFNRYELLVHGMDRQLQYLGEQYPQVKGLETWAISGDDHEGWFARQSGVDIGRYAEDVMRRGGRTDWRNLGYLEAYVALQHVKTGHTSQYLVMHPGGGSAYATSYTVQKIVEGFTGGEKPAVLQVGHYHKTEFIDIRNVWVIQAGCFTANTRVWTSRGAVKINRVKVGDQVMTHHGSLRRVTETHRRVHRGELVRMFFGRDGHSSCGLTATPEHPIWTRAGRSRDASWVRMADIAEGDRVAVRTVACVRCGALVPYWLTMCASHNAMDSPETRVKLSKSKGGFRSRRTRTPSSGEVHLVREIVPFCDLLSSQGWKVVPVGGGVIPDAIGFKDGRIVAFELEGRIAGSNIRLEKEAKYPGSAIDPFLDEVRWIDLRKERGRRRCAEYEIDWTTGFAWVLVRRIVTRPVRWGRGHSCVTVYNLTVDGAESYMAGNVLVHNCVQDQTVFARKKKIVFSLAATILLLRQNPDSGAIEEAVPYMKHYFNKGYYVNNRWSLSGDVSHMPRVIL